MKCLSSLVAFIAGLFVGEVATFGVTLLIFLALVPLVGGSHEWRVGVFVAVTGASLLVWARWMRPRRDAFAVGTAVGAVFGTLGALMAGLH